jgi:tetratricopeptide (TPR) repeat protein
MLGLTDRTIAKNPISFDKIESTWKERNYNIPYIMEREPDFILFSTGLKPSAPAEKALFLSSKFRHGYYPVFDDRSGLKVIYKKKDNLPEEDEYSSDPSFIDYFAEAIDYKSRGEYQAAFISARLALEIAPPGFYLPLSIMGKINLEAGNNEDGVQILRQALAISDNYATLSGRYLMDYYESVGDTTAVAEIFRRQNRINRLK